MPLFLYRVVLYLLLPWLLLRLLWHALRDWRYAENLPQRLGWFRARLKPGGIWIHAVSVGEVNAASPLVSYLLETQPHKPILITTMTPTGADRVRRNFGSSVQHCYLPYDYPGAVQRFLGFAAPCMGIIMETEIWPNLIARCNKQKVPLLFANMRLSARSHHGYSRFPKLVAQSLRGIHAFAMQGEADAQRVRNLGAPPQLVHVTGSLKFDITLPPSTSEAAQSVRRHLGDERLIWVAGSTHDGEEKQILGAFSQLRKRFESLLLVLVPRHPQRFNAVYRLCNRRHKTVLRSESPPQISPDCAVYIADTMGELPLLIAAGDLAFIGGSLVPVGGHNILEASAAGVPVVFGPHMFNFAEIADLLLRHGASVQAQNAQDLVPILTRLLEDAQLRDQYATRGLALVEKNRGALGKVCALVDAVLTE